MNATLWIDQRHHFTLEHREEWADQKEEDCTLNDLERDMEVVYLASIIKMQEDKLRADKKEADAKELPPDRQAARAQRQVNTTPRQDGVSSTSASATLYPNWILSRAGRRTSPDVPQPYQTPREGANGRLTIEEELDAASVFDPLQASQGTEGPQTLLHYCEAPACIPQFDIAKLGVSPQMSPVTDRENALLNLAPGSPLMRPAPPGFGRGLGLSGRSLYSGSPMSLGSPAVVSSLALALKVRGHPGTPSAFGEPEEQPRTTAEEEERPRAAAEEEEYMDATEDDDAGKTED